MKSWIAALAMAACMMPTWISASDESRPAERFDTLVSDYETWRLANDPSLAGRRGDLEAAARWPDLSFDAVEARRRAQQRFLERLGAVDERKLDVARRTSFAVLEYLLGSDVALAEFEPERMPFVNDSGFFSMPLNVAQSTRPGSPEAAEAWLTRLRRLPAYFEQQTRWLARGVETGFVQPAYVVEGVVGQLEAIVATPPGASPLLAPLQSLPAALEAAHGDALRRQARELVGERVRPAYERLLEFFREVYLAEPRKSLAISEVPEGRAYYRVLVRHHTTLDTTPEAVHRRGRAEVAR